MPALDVAADGDAVLVWTEDVPATTQVATYDAATGRWSMHDFPLDGSPASQAQAAIAADGTAVVAWLDVAEDVSQTSVHAARFGAGSWSSAARVSGETFTASFDLPPQVLVDGGPPTVLWSGFDTGDNRSHVQAVELDGGAWSALHDVADSDEPIGACAGGGDARRRRRRHLADRRPDTTGRRAAPERRLDDGGGAEPRTSAASSAASPTARSRSTERFHRRLVLQRRDAAEPHQQRCDLGAGAAAVRAGGKRAGDRRHAGRGTTRHGSSTTANAGSGTVLAAQRGSGWGAPQTLASGEVGAFADPRLASGGSGDLLALWRSFDANGAAAIAAAGFQGTPPRLERGDDPGDGDDRPAGPPSPPPPARPSPARRR